MAINYAVMKKELSLMEATGAAEEIKPFLEAAIRENDLRPQDWSLREGYEELVDGGLSEIRAWKRGQEYGGSVRESSAVRREMFMNVNGAMVTTMVELGYKKPRYIGERLVQTIPTSNLDGERMGGTAPIGLSSEEIGEGQPYGSSNFGEDWITTPELRKRGTKIGLTKELVIGDKTGQLFKRCKQVGDGIAYDKEIRITDMVIGAVPSCYKRKNNSATNVYGDNSGAHDWDNLLASTALTNWTSFEAMEMLFEGLVDPNTGLLIAVTPTQLIVPTGLKKRAEHLIGARSLKFVDNQANATTYQTESGNNVDNYEILSSPYIGSRQGNQTTWYAGDFREAFGYMEAWPLTVVQAPAGHPADFDSDIIAQWKASEMGVVVCLDPRLVAKMTA